MKSVFLVLCLVAIIYGIDYVYISQRNYADTSTEDDLVITTEGPAEECVTGIAPGMVLIIAGTIAGVICLVFF